jgi:hypothetical protein
MRVRQLIDISGTIDGQDWPGKGGEIELADHVAADLIANGYAEACGKAPKIETAAADPVTETAAAAKPRPRRTPKA